MLYNQSIDSCFGTGKLARSDYDGIRAEALQILEALKANQPPIISIANETADIAGIEESAENIKTSFDNLVILGTGGSSLCGHVLAGFAGNKFAAGKRVIFMQNIDPDSFAKLFSSIDLSATHFLAISKSGTSIEVVVQLLICLEAAKNLDCTKHFSIITTPGSNAMRETGGKLGLKIYDHNPDIGGRFSILSLVGLMPGAVAGVNPYQLRKGAGEFLANHAPLAAESASLHVAFMRANIWQNVLMTYPDRLEDLNIWYRQIWAESIGKNGTGSTPIKAMGTIDQHSQMQLYLAGPRNKFYNFITEQNDDKKLKINSSDVPEFKYLNGKSLSDLMNAEQQATIDTLIANNRPVRRIHLQKLDDQALGMLIMHLMLETIITARLLGVNPYDQPAVEAGKVKTRELMKQNSHP